MKRRDLVMVGAAAATVQTVLSATGCKAEGNTTALAASQTASAKDLAAALGLCIRVGEVCMTHCIELLSKGDKSLGPCAASVREMLAVCRAVEVIALSGSTHLREAAAFCASVCETCRQQCAKHSAHHQECAACEDACARAVVAARAAAAG